MPPTRFSSRAEEEAELLRTSLLELASRHARPGQPISPLAAGLTRLGKAETIQPESRFRDRSSASVLAWLEDCLRLRSRLNQYTATAILIPQGEEALIKTRHSGRDGTWVSRSAKVKCKRPGALACSEAAR